MSGSPDATTRGDRSSELVGPGALVLAGGVRLRVVESGSLGLFRADVHGGEPVGPRRLVRRVGAGQPLFSTASDAEGQRLLVVPIQRAVLREVELAEGWSDARTRARELAPLAHEWADLLGQVLSQLPAPSLPVRVASAQTIELEDGQDLAPEHRRTPWVRVLEGRLDLLGDETQPLAPGEPPLPLAPSLWMRARGATRVEVFPTERVERVEDLTAGLERLERWALAELRRQDERREIDELARLSESSRLQARRVRGAMQELVSVLEPLDQPPEDEEPLLAATRIVGRALGVEVRGAARAEDPARAPDPLEAIARASRLRIRRVRLTPRWWRRDCGPLIAWELEGDERAPVALVRRRGRYEILDPQSGTRRRVDARSSQRLGAEAVTFTRPLKDGRLGLPALARFAIVGRGGDLLLALVVGVAATVLAMLVPLGTAVIMDKAVPDADRDLLVQLGLGLCASVLGQALFHLSERLVLLRVGVGSEVATQTALWDRLLRLRPSFFRRFSSGDLQSRVMAVDDVGREITGNVMTTLFSSFLALLNLGLLAYYSAQLTLLAVGVATVVLVTTLGVGWRLRSTVRELMELDGRFFGLEIQLIQAVAKLRVAGAGVRAFTHWLGRYTAQLRLLARALRLSDTAFVFNTLVTPVSTVLLFAFAVRSLHQGEAGGFASGLTLGTFLAFNAAFGTFLGGITSLSDTVVGFFDTAAKARRIAPLLDEQPEVDQRKMDPGRISGQVALSSALFRYQDDGPNILEGVSLRSEPGEFIALVGPSGSGKSTALRLLLGFETPQSGSVLYDGQDLSTLDVLAVRRQLGVVLQNGRVAFGSIFENIGSGGVITLDEAWAAAEDAGFATDVRDMPMGMHTIVSEGGGNLSGGQRQRLLIARALATRPRILLLDEATSALDNRTQAVVSESLERLRVTRIVVAHRLSTIRRADRIYVLEAGRVVEQGSFEELMSGGGLFERMMARQLA